MRSLGVLVFALGSLAFGQSMLEVGAAAAGGAAGGAAGKKVSEGISTIFGQVDKQAKEASKDKSLKKEKPGEVSQTASIAPAAPTVGIVASPGPDPLTPASGHSAIAKPRPLHQTARADSRAAPRADQGSVPPPPPAPGRRPVAVVAKAEQPEPPPALDFALPALAPPPPPPVATLDDLKTLAVGMQRDVVLKLGAPASRITMIDSGHLLEIYHYTAKDATLGVVRLNDGAVSSVELR